MLKRKIFAANSLALILAIACPTPTLGADKETYSEREFSKILAEAVKKASKKDGYETNIKTLKGINGYSSTGTNTWTANVQGYNQRYVDATGRMHEAAENSVTIQTRPAVIVNKGNGFEFAFNSQPIFPFIYDRVIEQKHMKKVLRDWDWNKKHKDVNLQINRSTDSQIAITATYSYAGGVSDKDIRERVATLLHGARAVARLAMYSSADVLEKAREDLEKQKLTHLSKAEFLFLTGDRISKVEKEHKEATEGYWSFIYQKERQFGMFNYGDQFTASYYHKLPEGLSEANRTEILEAVQKYVDKKSLKNASNTEAAWAPNVKYIRVNAHFQFDGKLKGEKFHDAYWKFKDGYSKQLKKEIDKIVSKLG